MYLAFPQTSADRIGAVYFLAGLAIARSRLLSIHRCLQCANLRFNDQCPRHWRHCNRCPAVSLEPVAIKPSYRDIGSMRSALNTPQTTSAYTIGVAAPDEPWQQERSTHASRERPQAVIFSGAQTARGSTLARLKCLHKLVSLQAYRIVLLSDIPGWRSRRANSSLAAMTRLKFQGRTAGVSIASPRARHAR